MHLQLPRRAIVTAGACCLLLGLAAPSVVVTAAAGATKRPAPVSAIPRPNAPHSGKMVPGVTGAAASRSDPPISAAKRWAELNAESHRAARHHAGRPRVQPSLTPWSGTLHTAWGTYPAQTVYGAQATQSLNPGTVLPSSDSPAETLFAPTLDPSGITCIEMSTIYNDTGDQVGAFDWCVSQPTFKKITDINSSFLATYTTTVGGQPFYSVQDVQTDPATNSWTAYLYNYQTGAWDTYYTSANTSKLSNSGGGWDQNEVVTTYNSATGEGVYCTQTYGANMESTGLQYQLSPGGSWVPATPANSNMDLAYPRGSNIGCANSTFWLPTANSEWRVTNGTHGAAELVGAGSSKCVDTNGQVFANGTEEQIYTCHSGVGQTWTWNASGELSTDGGAFCLDATNYGTTPGTKIQLWKCNGTTNQEWSFSIKHTIVGEGSGLCLGVTGGATGNGAQLELENCDDTLTSQQWSWS